MTRYTVLIDGETGGHGVVFPDLPGCNAMGDTVEQAISNAGEAVKEWAEVTVESGGTVPAPRPIEVLHRDPDVIEALAAGSTLASVPLILSPSRPVKANLSLSPEILAAIDEAAKGRGLTRSAFIEFMARHALPELQAGR